MFKQFRKANKLKAESYSLHLKVSEMQRAINDKQIVIN